MRGSHVARYIGKIANAFASVRKNSTGRVIAYQVASSLRLHFPAVCLFTCHFFSLTAVTLEKGCDILDMRGIICLGISCSVNW